MSDIETEQRDELLRRAAVLRDARLLLQQLDAGADPNAPDHHGKTALTLAVIHCAVDIVDLLLNRGADPNAADAVGNTPLHYAAYDMARRMMRSLIDAGADTCARNIDGVTPRDKARIGYGLCLDELRRRPAQRDTNSGPAAPRPS